MPSSFIPFDIENAVVITTDSIKQTKDDKYNNEESSINHIFVLKEKNNYSLKFNIMLFV